MEKSQEIQPETKREYKTRDRFYLIEDAEIILEDNSRVQLHKGGILEIILPGTDVYYLVRKTDATGTEPKDGLLPAKCLDTLPMLKDRRKGPVSAENPMSLERAQQLLSKEKRCEMRGEELVPEQQVRDLMLEALERVQQEKDEPFTKDYEKPADQ